MIQCFWTAPNGRAAIFLRRYKSSSEAKCQGKYGYHNVQAFIDEGSCELAPSKRDPKYTVWQPIDFSDDAGNWPPHNDPRWPQACECGYVFQEKDEWQLRWDPLYAGSPDGIARPMDELPVGAMWRASWYEECWGEIPAYTGRANPTDARFRRGTESWCISVNTPDGEWCIDQRSTQGSFWERDALPLDIKPGDPVKITASPSILQPRYHGWLRNGVLVPA